MIYEYACTGCEHEWEAEQSINDQKITTCPKCNEEKAKRLISRSSFQLKGPGWFNSGGY